MDVAHAEVEAAIAGVPGVAQALVRPDPDTGRTRLRIALAPDGDADDVAHAVAGVLREQFRIEVDPSAIRPRPIITTPTMLGDGEGGPDVWRSSLDDALDDAGPATPGPVAFSPAPEAAPRRADAGDEADRSSDEVATDHAPRPAVPLDMARPRIRDLRVDEEGLKLDVEVALEVEGREYRGRASGASVDPYRLMTVARATVDAIQQLFPTRARLEVDTVAEDTDRPAPVILSTVTLITEEGPLQLVGVAFLRKDRNMSTLKATLDAINRPVGMLVADLG